MLKLYFVPLNVKLPFHVAKLAGGLMVAWCGGITANLGTAVSAFWAKLLLAKQVQASTASAANTPRVGKFLFTSVISDDSP
jgi:hypothetical protein